MPRARESRTSKRQTWTCLTDTNPCISNSGGTQGEVVSNPGLVIQDVTFVARQCQVSLTTVMVQEERCLRLIENSTGTCARISDKNSACYIKMKGGVENCIFPLDGSSGENLISLKVDCHVVLAYTIEEKSPWEMGLKIFDVTSSHAGFLYKSIKFHCKLSVQFVPF